MDTNFYQIIGLPPDADSHTLEIRYKFLIQVFHPDRFHNNQKMSRLAEEEAKRINEAYQTLSNPRKRSQYDAKLTSENRHSNPILDHELQEARRRIDQLQAHIAVVSLIFESQKANSARNPPD